jgi:hypothetical protein
LFQYNLLFKHVIVVSEMTGRIVSLFLVLTLAVVALAVVALAVEIAREEK